MLHVDLDQFVVAVELLRRPALRGVPVIVGTVGDPTRRGVVSGCSYEAREFGIRSGMSLHEARRRCPHAVFLPPDFETYREASRQTMAVLAGCGDEFEEAGWDEAFLGVDSDEPEHRARDIQAAVLARTGLVCSVGIGDTKVRAKVASGLAKPGGVFRLTAKNWLEVVGPYAPRRLWGVGPRTEARLAALGIRTVRALAGADPAALTRAFGPTLGPHLVALARGEGPSAIVEEHPPIRSHGHQRTFDPDVVDPETVRREVRRDARVLADDLRRLDRGVRRVVVTIRFAPFRTHAHGVTLRRPTGEAGRIETAALAALDRFSLDSPVRMVGVRAELTPPDAREGRGPPGRRRPRPATDVASVH